MKRDSHQIFDELLVIKCQQRDTEAQNLLWKRWQPRVLKWSYDFMRDQELAAEIAQESWLSIFKGISRLRDPALFRFWAYKIVQRRAADWIRKEQKKRSSIEEVKYEVLSNEADDSEDEKVDQMLLLIKALPQEHQEVLRMFYLEKIPVKMIAKLLGVAAGTIKSRLFYARQQLKEKLKEIHHE